jgi:hypothetical protein
MRLYSLLALGLAALLVTGASAGDQKAGAKAARGGNCKKDASARAAVAIADKAKVDDKKAADDKKPGTAQQPRRPGFGGRGSFAGRGSGQVLSSFLQEQLKLTDDQKKQIEALQKDIDEKVSKILTEDQKKQLKEIRAGGGRPGAGGQPGRRPGGQGRPGAGRPSTDK